MLFFKKKNKKNIFNLYNRQYFYLPVKINIEYNNILSNFVSLLDKFDNCFLRHPDKIQKDLFFGRLHIDLIEKYEDENIKTIGIGYDIGYYINSWYENNQKFDKRLIKILEKGIK